MHNPAVILGDSNLETVREWSVDGFVMYTAQYLQISYKVKSSQPAGISVP